MKKGFIYVGLVLATSLTTTVFQPLSYLGTWAAPTEQAGCQTYKETGKTVCGRFLQYWQQTGGLPQQGYPISNEFREKSDLDGKEYTVQYFERAVFEMHPENKPPYDVLLSQLGTFQFKRKYPNGEPGAPPPTPVPPPPPGVGVKVPLREGVTITLTQDTGLVNCDAGPAMFWRFTIENQSNLDFVLTQDRDSTYQVDSTGKRYAFTEQQFCGARFGGSTALPKSQSAKVEAVMDARNVPTNATYLQLHVTISGQALTFRYPLR